MNFWWYITALTPVKHVFCVLVCKRTNHIELCNVTQYKLLKFKLQYKNAVILKEKATSDTLQRGIVFIGSGPIHQIGNLSSKLKACFDGYGLLTLLATAIALHIMQILETNPGKLRRKGEHPPFCYCA